jgi:NHL repeat-containing protein
MGEAALRIPWRGGPFGWALRGILLAFLLLAVLASQAGSAEAASLCTTQGSGPGQCSNPEGVATDFETNRVYVADRGNDRVNVFEADGDFLFSFGSGQLSSPEFIAVDNIEASAAHHDIYVTDANKQVSRFKPDGSFVGSFEGGSGGCHELTGLFLPIAIGPAGNVFVAVTEGNEPNFTARVEKFSPSGECLGETLLLTGNVILLTLAVDASEDAYVSVGRLGGLELRKYDLVTPETEVCKVEVDPEILTRAVALDKAGQLFAAQAERRSKPAAAPFRVVTEYDVSSCPPAKHVRRFGYGELTANSTGIAALHTPEGDVFASEGGANPVKYLKYPPAGPIAPAEGMEVTRIGSANADARAEINPEGKATKYHFDYVEQAQFEINGFTDAIETPEQTLSQAAGAFRVNAATGLLGCPDPSTEIGGGDCLKPETTYRWRVVSTNADGAGLGTAEGPPFKTKAPIEIEDLWAMEVGTDAATLGTVINPVGALTTGHFEYVTDAQFEASGFDEATEVPAGGELNFGGGETGSKRIATLFPLAPGTLYHYRVAATNVVFEESSTAEFLFSPPKTFRTFEPRGPPQPCENDAFRTGAAALLPDCRAYEMVSPLDKANGDIKLLEEFISRLGAVVNQSATSGDRLTYGSFRAFGDAQSAPYTSQYIAERDLEDGWETHSINPPRDNSIRGGFDIDNEYRAFSDDLCEGWITTFFEPTLTADAIVGYRNLYRRTELCEEGTETYEALTTAKPLNLPLPQNGTNLYLVEPQGHSADGSVNAFASNDSLAVPGTPGQPMLCKSNSADCKKRLYVKRAGGTTSFVCILPTGVPISANENCMAGSYNIVARFGTSRSPNVKGALSEDGKRIFWSRWAADLDPHGPIYLRENPLGSGGNCSGPEAPCSKDVSKGGENASGTPGAGAHFWQGASDGSAALYTVGGTSGDLYRYVTATNTSELIAGEVQGLVGASEDVSRVYFASKEVLTGAEENEIGQKAKAGAFNLYLYEAGGGGSYRFIGQLAGIDLTNSLAAEPVRHTAQVSPSGLAAAFMSAGQMTGYDNTDAKSGVADTEAFVYDASANGGAGELVCASCNPTNGRPAGKNLAEEGGTFWAAARIPASYSTLAEPEVLAPDGQRLIFEAADALVPDDTNGRLDVYQWERAGVGSCEESETTFSETAGGCIDLISSGQGLADSEIVDVSQTAAGADVFFNTLEGLVPQDYGLRDIYDARIGGGFPPPPPPPIDCEGETCQNPPPAPERRVGATATNFGPGNMTQKPKKKQGCPKGKHKVKKGGKSRCVANKKGKGSKRQGRAAR